MKGIGNGGIITNGLFFSIDPLNIKSNPDDDTNAYDLTSYNSDGVLTPSEILQNYNSLKWKFI